MDPSGYLTSNGRLYEVRTSCKRPLDVQRTSDAHWDITSIRRRPNFDEFAHHLHVLFRCNFADQKIHVISTYFFRCNFDGPKIHVVSTYFFQRNFDGQKILVVFTYLFRCNFDGGKIHVVCMYFFDQILTCRNSTSFLVKLQANGNIFFAFLGTIH